MIKCKSDTITETIAEINSVLESLTLEQFQKILEDNRSYIENCEYFSMEEYCLFLFWNFKTKKITLKPEWDSTVPILMIEQVPLEESYTTMMGDRRYNQTIQEQIFNSSELFSQERLDKMIGNTQTWYKEFLVDKEKLSCFLSGKYWNGIKFDCYKNISNGLFPFSFLPQKYVTDFLESYISEIVFEVEGTPTICTEYNNLVLKDEFQHLSDELDEAIYSELVESMGHTWETCLVNLNISHETRTHFVKVIVKGLIKHLPESDIKYNTLKDLDFFFPEKKLRKF